MRWHSFDIVKLVSLLLPMKMRRLNLVLFLNVLTLPLGYLVAQILYKMQHDGRVIYLEKVLNEAFDMPGYSAASHESSKIIYIASGEMPDETYLFQMNEPDDPPFVGLDANINDGDDVWLYTQEELDAQYNDFRVVVPMALQEFENKIKNLVDYYKMAGKKYKIEYI